MNQTVTHWPSVTFGLSLSCFAAYQQFKLPPVLPTLLEAYGYDRTLAGGFMSIYAMIGLVLSIILGRWIHRHGAARPVQSALGLVLIGNVLTMGYPESGWVVLVARGLEGVAFAVFAITGPVLVTKNASPRHLAMLVALVASWIPVGQLVAAGLAPLATALDDWRLLWWIAIALTLALAVWSRSMSGVGKPLQPGGTAGERERQQVRFPPGARAGLVLTGAIFMLWSCQYFAYMTWLPQYLVEVLGLDPSAAALGYALPVFLLLVFNLVTGAILRSGAPLSLVLVCGLFLQAVVWLLVPWTGAGWGGLASLVVYGIGAGLTPTCLFALPAAIMGPSQVGGTAFGIVMTGRNMGVLVGPILLPGIQELTGTWAHTGPTFAVVTVGALALALVLATRRYRL